MCCQPFLCSKSFDCTKSHGGHRMQRDQCPSIIRWWWWWWLRFMENFCCCFFLFSMLVYCVCFPQIRTTYFEQGELIAPCRLCTRLMLFWGCELGLGITLFRFRFCSTASQSSFSRTGWQTRGPLLESLSLSLYVFFLCLSHIYSFDIDGQQNYNGFKTRIKRFKLKV